MFRRILCLLCAALIIAWIVPACSESGEGSFSYDFDLTFHLNADSFPELLRSRAEGYASLVNRLGLRGKEFKTCREHLTAAFTEVAQTDAA